MPTTSKAKTYKHPSLAKLLNRGGACGEGAANALKFASRYPTMTDAVKACRGDKGQYRLDWLAFLGNRTAYHDAATGPKRTAALRKLARSIAERMDRAVTRTRRAAKTRAANRAA